MSRFFPLAISILMGAGCSRHETVAAAPHTEPTTAEVEVETVYVSTIAAIYRASGTVRARQIAAIAPKIVASILEVRVESGSRVQPGQTLVVLDRRDLEASVRAAEATRIETENGVGETENAIASAQANVELARVTHQRFQDLLAKASVSQQEFDESQARLKSANAALAIAVSRNRQAEARRNQAEAEVAGSRVALGYATLTAPFAGLVAERRADPGSMATPGVPLLTIEREGSLRLEASIDEARAGLAHIGDDVAVEIDGLNRTVSGRVSEILPSVDPSTRTLIAKIDLPAIPGLRTGMFGRAVFADGSREAITVRQSAVLERGQIRAVHVVERNTTRLRFVTIGEAHSDRREILSGLAAGETVVVAPPPLLVDGGRVAIQERAK